MANNTVLYKKEFEEDIDEIYNYIFRNSEQNARKFSDEVKSIILWIIKNPTAGNLETKIYSKNNWYRYKIVMKSWKIIYKLTKTTITFLRIIHVKRNSEKLQNLIPK